MFHNIRNVVYYHDPICPFVVGAGNRSEPFLPRSVPLHRRDAEQLRFGVLRSCLKPQLFENAKILHIELAKIRSQHR